MNRLTEEQRRLAEDYIPLAKKMVHDRIKAYPYYRPLLADMYQTAYVGLAKAASFFDETRGTKFSTLACTIIKQDLTNFLIRDARGGMKDTPKSLGFRGVTSEVPDDFWYRRAATYTPDPEPAGDELYVEVKRRVFQKVAAARAKGLHRDTTSHGRVEAFFATTFEEKSGAEVARARGRTKQLISAEVAAVRPFFEEVCREIREEA